jgi:predicted ArsR family transcriptional regulator
VDTADRAAALRALAALEEPSRRALYDFTRTAGRPVTREQAAAAVGISRKLAAFHMDKLVEVGLLVADFEASARTRQLGRSPKAYRPSPGELRFFIPDRHPETLAELLLEAIAAARPGEAPVAAALRVAYDAGRRVGVATRQAERPGRLGPERAMALASKVLGNRGFEPARDSATCVRLHNCPYLPMAAQASDLVCGMNQRHVAGLLDGLQAPDSVAAVLAPGPGRCCVELHVVAGS